VQHVGGGAVWKVQREHQATMCVAGPEGEKPQGNLD